MLVLPLTSSVTLDKLALKDLVTLDKLALKDFGPFSLKFLECKMIKM